MRFFLLLTFSYFSIFAQENVLFEKLTGTWCGWCPDAALIIHDMQELHPNTIPVFVHYDTDIMAIADGNTIAQEYSNGSPSGLFNRVHFDGQWNVGTPRTEWLDLADVYVSNFQSAVAITSSSILNEETRALSIDASITALAGLSNDVRINCYIMEDHVQETSSSYDQRNYFNGIADHPLELLGDPITNYEHRYVLRNMLGGAWGIDNVVNSNMNSVSEHSFEYTIPEDYNLDEVYYIILVQEFNDDENARSVIGAKQFEMTIEQTPMFSDLEVSLSTPFSNYSVGAFISLNVSIVNTGEIATENVALKLYSDYNLLFSSSSSSFESASGEWNVGTVAAGEEQNITVSFIILSAGQVNVSAEVISSSTEDIDSSPNNDNGSHNEDDEDAIVLTIQENETTSIADVHIDNMISIMGNNLQIKSESEIDGLIIFDLNGRIVQKVNNLVDGTNIQLNMPQGFYLVQYNVNGKNHLQKIVIN